MIEKILKILNPLNILFVIQHLAWRLANARRRLRRADYIFFPLPSELPPLPEQRGFLQRRLLGPPPLSLLDLDSQFRRIAQDPRTQGVVLLLPRLSMPLADLQSLRESILRLRAGGLRVLCYAHNYDMATYYVASAADRVLLLLGYRADPALLVAAGAEVDPASAVATVDPATRLTTVPGLYAIGSAGQGGRTSDVFIENGLPHARAAVAHLAAALAATRTATPAAAPSGRS